MKAISNHSIILLDIGDTLVHITEPFETYTRKALQRCYPFIDTELNEIEFVDKALLIRNEIRENAHKTLLEESIYSYFEEIEKAFGSLKIGIEELEEIYISAELDITRVFPEAHDFLQGIKNENRRVIAATNNFSPLHVKLVLDQFDLLPYFDDLFISGVVGYRKPNKKFMESLLKKYNLDVKNCIIIGDKLDMDIAVANNVGMSSVWINRANKPNNSNYTPSFNIQNLLELL